MRSAGTRCTAGKAGCGAAAGARRRLSSNRRLRSGKFRLGRFLEFKKGLSDAFDVVRGEFAVLFTEVFAQRLEPLGGIDELDLALAVLRLAVGEHPDVGGDAGVVEEIERQGDNGFEPVILDDPAADIAFALASIAGEE
jgi:hypothetical protein